MKFSIIGGDLRLVKLAKMLANDKHDVFIYGMEKSKELDSNIYKCKSVQEAIENCDIVISSVPFSKKENEVYAIFNEKTIYINNLIEDNYKDKIFIAGSIKEKYKEVLQQKYKKVIDIMDEEELIILNTIATAEGTVKVAIENTDTILQGRNILILGFGRVGKIVANKFKKLDANVTCAARKQADLAWIMTLGYNAANINNLEETFPQYDIIINTVPREIIGKKEIMLMKKDVLLIDLASSPGGIDGKTANEANLKYVWAQALPGKIAPISSAEFIKKTIYNVLKQ